MLFTEDVDESFEDLVLGPRRINPARVGGDFVVGRADTAASIEPGYQSAVVIDDADDGVTRVLRGADLLTSAARQRQLARALGLPPVAYGHFPLVVGPDGRRLAKRHGDTRLASLAARGVTAAEVRAWIAASAGVPAEEAGRLVPRSFDPSRIPTEPVVPPPAWS